MSYVVTSYAMRFSFASVSLRPTRATSGSVNVHHGMTEKSARKRLKLPNSAFTDAYHAVCEAVCVNWYGPATSPHA